MARGVSPSVARSRAASRAAWTAAVAAVEAVCGKPPPTRPGVLRGGRRHLRAEVQLRKLALYTTVCGLNICAAHAAQSAGLAKRYVQDVLREVEEQREDAALDLLLDQLTQAARARLSPPAPARRAA